MKRKKQRNENITAGDCFTQSLLHIWIFLLVCVLCALAFSFILYRRSDPTAQISLFSKICLYVSAFISTFAFCKKMGSKQLLCGIFYGLSIVVLLIIVSLWIPKKVAVSYIGIFLVLPFCILASVLSQKKRVKKHRNKRKISIG